MISYILALLTGVAFLVADQLTKAYISANFTLGETSDLLKGFIDLTYIHNKGGAWGMLSGYTWLLISMTIIIMIICIALLLKFGLKDKLMFWAMSLVMFGGIGNMIDRIFRGGNVVDFLHFSFWKSFPVFNVADCAVVIGAGLVILYFVIGMINDSRRKSFPQEQAEPAEDE